MKKPLIIVGLIAVLAVIIMYSCRKLDSDSSSPITLTMEEAKQWYLNDEGDIRLTPAASKLLKSGSQDQPELIYYWKGAKESANDSVSVVEVPFLMKGNLGFALLRYKDTRLLTSMSTLVIQKNKRNKELKKFIMTLIGDSAYLLDKKFDLTSNHYLNKDKNFSGMAIYTDLNGEFIKGSRYINGKETSRALRIEGKKKASLTKETWCDVQTVYTFSQWCSGTVYNGEYSAPECGSWTYEGSYDVVLACFQYGSEQGSEGSGGGGGGSNSSSPSASIVGEFTGFPCAESTLSFIAGTNQGDCIDTELTRILQNTFGTSDRVDVVFYPELLSSDLDGEFNFGYQSKGDSLRVAININILNNASGPYLAATFLHEGLHAYFAYQKNHDPYFTYRYPCFGISNGALVVLSAKDSEHEYLTRYVKEIAETVQKIYPNISTADAIYLSWGGLQMTRAYKNNIDESKRFIPGGLQTKIEQVNKAHRAAGGCGNYR